MSANKVQKWTYCKAGLMHSTKLAPSAGQNLARLKGLDKSSPERPILCTESIKLFLAVVCGECSVAIVAECVRQRSGMWQRDSWLCYQALYFEVYNANVNNCYPTMFSENVQSCISTLIASIGSVSGLWHSSDRRPMTRFVITPIWRGSDNSVVLIQSLHHDADLIKQESA